MTGVLFHWSPVERRDQIQRYGLLPGQDPVTCSPAGIDYLCLCPDPARAWNLSAAVPWTPAGEWDLWQVLLIDAHDVRLRIEDGEVWELMVYTLIPPDRLWRAGTRDTGTKPPEEAP